MIYKMTRIPGHPLTINRQPQPVHRYVLYDKIGPDPHPCHWCGKTVYWDKNPKLLTDYLDYDKQNNDPENLVPACMGCNAFRTPNRKRNPKVLDNELFVEEQGRRLRVVECVCAHCNKTFLRALSRIRKTGKIFCSPACMYACLYPR